MANMFSYTPKLWLDAHEKEQFRNSKYNVEESRIKLFVDTVEQLNIQKPTKYVKRGIIPYHKMTKNNLISYLSRNDIKKYIKNYNFD